MEIFNPVFTLPAWKLNFDNNTIAKGPGVARGKKIRKKILKKKISNIFIFRHFSAAPEYPQKISSHSVGRLLAGYRQHICI